MNKNNRKEKKDNLNILKFIGPGLLVTVGFIDPGNWASNIAAGSGYGYILLWMVTLSTIMLIILQHNAAHLGIVTGLCLSEAASRYINRTLKNVILVSASNTPIPDQYVKQTSTVDVNDASGNNPIQYEVWIYKPASISPTEIHKLVVG